MILMESVESLKPPLQQLSTKEYNHHIMNEVIEIILQDSGLKIDDVV